MNFKVMKDQNELNWTRMDSFQEKVRVNEIPKKQTPNFIGKMKHSGKPLLLNDNPPNISSTEMALKANPTVIESKFEKIGKEYWKFGFNKKIYYQKLLDLRSEGLKMLEEMGGNDSYLYKNSDKKRMVEILKKIDKEFTQNNSQE